MTLRELFTDEIGALLIVFVTGGGKVSLRPLLGMPKVLQPVLDRMAGNGFTGRDDDVPMLAPDEYNSVVLFVPVSDMNENTGVVIADWLQGLPARLHAAGITSGPIHLYLDLDAALTSGFTIDDLVAMVTGLQFLAADPEYAAFAVACQLPSLEQLETHANLVQTLEELAGVANLLLTVGPLGDPDGDSAEGEAVDDALTDLLVGNGRRRGWTPPEDNGTVN